MIQSGMCMGILAAPPCTTYSCARHPALRSRDYIYGLPTLNERDKAIATAADKLTHHVIALLLFASRCEVPWVVENTQTSMIWHLPRMDVLQTAEAAEGTVLHQCQFGVPWRKATILLASRMVGMQRMSRKCRPFGQRKFCSRTCQRHEILQGSSSGKVGQRWQQPSL